MTPLLNKNRVEKLFYTVCTMSLIPKPYHCIVKRKNWFSRHFINHIVISLYHITTMECKVITMKPYKDTIIITQRAALVHTLKWSYIVIVIKDFKQQLIHKRLSYASNTLMCLKFTMMMLDVGVRSF